MKLTFDMKKVAQLVREWDDRLKAGEEARTLYEDNTGPGFWLVGDQGVYLMANWKLKEGEKPSFTYAKQCDPDKLDFDTWWENKRRSFGGDDGAEFISLDDVKKWMVGERPSISISPTQFALTSYVPKVAA